LVVAPASFERQFHSDSAGSVRTLPDRQVLYHQFKEEPAMKKLLFLTPLFVVGFGAGPVQAGPDHCQGTCIYEPYCSSETGPLCINPSQPYYLYKINGECLEYPGQPCPDEFAGCCKKHL
jgi:hypothetical protein